MRGRVYPLVVNKVKGGRGGVDGVVRFGNRVRGVVCVCLAERGCRWCTSP